MSLSPDTIEDLAHERTAWLNAFGLRDSDVMDDEVGEYIRPDEGGPKVRLPNHIQVHNIYR